MPQREDYILRMIAQMARVLAHVRPAHDRRRDQPPEVRFFAEILYLEWSRLQTMGKAVAAERCADRALLLHSLAYDDIVVDEETMARVKQLEGFPSLG